MICSRTGCTNDAATIKNGDALCLDCLEKDRKSLASIRVKILENRVTYE